MEKVEKKTLSVHINGKLSIFLPVREAYWEKTSLGVGPSIMKTSMMPLSEIQRTSVCGVSLDP